MKTIAEQLNEHDICVYFKNHKFLTLQYKGIKDDKYIFMPIYETSKIFQEEIELSEDTLNSSIFIRDRYDYWPEDVVKAYTEYQIKIINEKSKNIGFATANMNKKYKDFLSSKEYNMLYESNIKVSESFDKIKELLKTYGQ